MGSESILIIWDGSSDPNKDIPWISWYITAGIEKIYPKIETKIPITIEIPKVSHQCPFIKLKLSPMASKTLLFSKTKIEEAKDKTILEVTTPSKITTLSSQV